MQTMPCVQAQLLAHQTRAATHAHEVAVPVFKTGSTSGDGLQLLHTFLRNLSCTAHSEPVDAPVSTSARGSLSTPVTQFVVDDILTVKGVGQGKHDPSLCADSF